MRIDELKRIAKENDYELTKSDVHYKLTHKYCDNYISINGVYKNRLWISIPFFCDHRDFNMIKAAVEFAETPIDDREEEKKFYLKHKYFKHWDDVQYFTFDYIHKCAYLNCKLSICQAMQQFTLKEIEELKEKFDADLADFELVEVKE